MAVHKASKPRKQGSDRTKASGLARREQDRAKKRRHHPPLFCLPKSFKWGAVVKWAILPHPSLSKKLSLWEGFHFTLRPICQTVFFSMTWVTRKNKDSSRSNWGWKRLHKYTPFQLVYGREAVVPAEFLIPVHCSSYKDVWWDFCCGMASWIMGFRWASILGWFSSNSRETETKSLAWSPH